MLMFRAASAVETGKIALNLKRWWDRILALSGRRAKSAPVWFNGLKTLAQSAVMWLVFLGVCPFIAWVIENWLHTPRFSFPLWLAVLLFILGAIGAQWSAWFIVTRGDGTPLPLDSTNRLVIAGPYRWLRNPMAVASLVQGLAIGLAVGSPLILLYVLTGALLWNYIARPWEELDLERKFGAEYARYKQTVRCWLPRSRPYQNSTPKVEPQINKDEESASISH